MAIAGVTDPEWQRDFGVALTSWNRESPPLLAGVHPGLARGMTSDRRFQPVVGRTLRFSGAPCRAELRPRQHRVCRPEPELFPRPGRQPQPFPEPRAPSADGSRSPGCDTEAPRPAWTLRAPTTPGGAAAFTQARCGPPLVPWLRRLRAQLPTCVHAQLLRARSTARPAIRRLRCRPHAGRRLLQFKDLGAHRSNRPNPVLSV